MKSKILMSLLVLLVFTNLAMAQTTFRVISSLTSPPDTVSYYTDSTQVTVRVHTLTDSLWLIDSGGSRIFRVDSTYITSDTSYIIPLPLQPGLNAFVLNAADAGLADTIQLRVFRKRLPQINTPLTGLDWGDIPVRSFRDSVATVSSSAIGLVQEFDSVLIKVSVRNAQKFSVNSDTLFYLMPNDSIHVSLRFSPKVERGSFSDTLLIERLTPQDPPVVVGTVILRGDGINPKPNYSANDMVFPRMQDGYLSSARDIRVINEGADSLRVDSISIFSSSFQNFMLIYKRRFAPHSNVAANPVRLTPMLGTRITQDTTIAVRLRVTSHYLGLPTIYTDTLEFSTTVYQPSLSISADHIFQDSAHLHIPTDSARTDLAVAVGGVTVGDTSAHITLKDISLEGGDAGGFVINNRALLVGDTLFSGQEKSVLLAFRQNLTGNFNSSLRLIYGVTATIEDTVLVQLTATMLAAALQVSATDPIDFGRVGSLKTISIIYRNTGNWPLVLLQSFTNGTQGFLVDNPNSVIAASDSLIENITFNPESGGTYYDTLVVSWDDSQAEDSLRTLRRGLVVNVITPPVFLTTQVDFGRIQDGFQSDSIEIQVNNRENLELSVDSIIPADSSSGRIIYSAPTILHTGISRFQFKFNPDLKRLIQDSLQLSTDLKVYSHYENFDVDMENTVKLTATVFQPGIKLIGFSDFDSAFVHVPSDSARHNITIALDGVFTKDSAQVTILDISYTGSQPGFTITNRNSLLGQTIANPQSQTVDTVQLAFRIDSLGEFTNTLQITAQLPNTAVIKTFTMDLNVRMLAAVLQIAATEIDFGSVNVGDTTSRSVYLKNTGNWPLELYPLPLLFKNGQLGFSVGHGGLVWPNDSLRLTINLHSNRRYLNTDTLVISYRDLGNTNSTARTGNISLKVMGIEIFVEDASLTSINERLYLILHVKTFFDYDTASISASDFKVGFLDSVRLDSAASTTTDSTISIDLDRYKMVINKAFKDYSPSSRPPQDFFRLQVDSNSVRLKSKTEATYHWNDGQVISSVDLGNIDPWATELALHQSNPIFSPGPPRNKYDGFRKQSATINVPIKNSENPGIVLTTSLYRKGSADQLQYLGLLGNSTSSNSFTWNGMLSGNYMTDGIYVIQTMVEDPSYRVKNSFPLLYEVIVDIAPPNINFSLLAPEPADIPGDLRPVGVQDNDRVVKHTDGFKIIGSGNVEDNVCTIGNGAQIGSETLSFPLYLPQDSMNMVLTVRDLQNSNSHNLNFDIVRNPQECEGQIQAETDSTLFTFDRLKTALNLTGEGARISLEGMYLADLAGNVAETAFMTRIGLRPLSADSPLVYWIYSGDNLDWLLERTFINYPNPFSPNANQKTTISYTLARNTNLSSGEILIFTDTGELVSRIPLSSEDLQQNTHEKVWDGRDFINQPLGRGVYFAVLKLPDTQKRVLKIAIY